MKTFRIAIKATSGNSSVRVSGDTRGTGWYAPPTYLVDGQEFPLEASDRLEIGGDWGTLAMFPNLPGVFFLRQPGQDNYTELDWARARNILASVPFQRWPSRRAFQDAGLALLDQGRH